MTPARTLRTVLFVDDDPLVRLALKRVVARHGYEVLTAESGAQALELMEQHPVPLVVSDKDMPGMNGLQFLELVRERHPLVYRVMLTGKADLESTMRAINDVGVYRFVEKPWTNELLISTLHSAFETIELEQALRDEREQSERLLLNVLPRGIAARLKAGERPIADTYPAATVLFSDLVDFTRLSAALSAREVVTLLEAVFSEFDELAGQLGVEKIKTLGDGYLAVAGLPAERADHVPVMVEMAFGMLAAVERVNAARGTRLALRIGVHTGPVVAGVIGSRRFSYDLWGDTVNTASRMEAAGQPGRVHVTEAVVAALGDRYRIERRGPIELKGKGPVPTAFVLGQH